MSNTIGSLSSVFTNLISDLMEIERQPLIRLQQQRDSITLQKGIYTDLKTKLDAFQSAVHALKSNEPSYNFNSGRSVSVSSGTTGVTFATVTASNYAAVADYQMSVTSLAKEHRVRSAQQLYATQALGLAGSFVIGGEAERRIAGSTPVTNTVSSFAAATQLTAGRTELGTGSYFVEVREQTAGVFQFRLVDSEGTAMSINRSGGTDTTSEWQSLPAAGAFDTGRGLVINFEAGPYTTGLKGAGAASVSYVAKGATVAVTATDTLVDIASRINGATYASGNAVRATVVDNQLILSNSLPGAGRTIVASDVAGSTNSILRTLDVLAVDGSFAHTMQTSSGMSMVVNGLAVTRSRNTGLTDVINGVTLNLAADAEGKTATVKVSADTTAERTVIDTFIQKFNDLVAFLSDKVSTVKQTDGTYKRGALAGDQMFSSLRLDLLRSFNASAANSGIYTRMSEIGLQVNTNMQVSIVDANKLDLALRDNKTSVTALVDAVMTSIDTRLDRYLGSTGYMDRVSASAATQLENTKTQIETMNKRLLSREEELRNQFGAAQAQLMSMSYTSQQFSALYGSYNQYG